MRKLLVLVVFVAVGCVSDEESSVTGASGVDPIFLRFGDIKGESTDKGHDQWISVAFLDTTATVVYGTDCIDASCLLATATAQQQSPAVWRFDDAHGSPNHINVHGDPLGDPLIEIMLGGHGFAGGAQPQLVTCVPSPHCPPIKGRICVPICSLNP